MEIAVPPECMYMFSMVGCQIPTRQTDLLICLLHLRSMPNFPIKLVH